MDAKLICKRDVKKHKVEYVTRFVLNNIQSNLTLRTLHTDEQFDLSFSVGYLLRTQ